MEIKTGTGCGTTWYEPCPECGVVGKLSLCAGDYLGFCEKGCQQWWISNAPWRSTTSGGEK